MLFVLQPEVLTNPIREQTLKASRVVYIVRPPNLSRDHMRACIYTPRAGIQVPYS